MKAVFVNRSKKHRITTNSTGADTGGVNWVNVHPLFTWGETASRGFSIVRRRRCRRIAPHAQYDQFYHVLVHNGDVYRHANQYGINFFFKYAQITYKSTHPRRYSHTKRCRTFSERAFREIPRNYRETYRELSFKVTNLISKANYILTTNAGFETMNDSKCEYQHTTFDQKAKIRSSRSEELSLPITVFTIHLTVKAEQRGRSWSLHPP